MLFQKGEHKTQRRTRLAYSHNLKGLKEKNLTLLYLGFHISTPEIGMLFGKGLHHCLLVIMCVLKVGRSRRHALSEYCTSSSNIAYMSVEEEEYKFKLTVMKCRPTAVPLPRDPANFPLWSAPGNTTSRLSPPRLCFDGRVSGQTRP